MNPLSMSFVATRSRRPDHESSRRLASKTAAGGKAGALRRRIQAALLFDGPMTARELAVLLGEDFLALSRRISETAEIGKTSELRDGGMVWHYTGPAPF